MAGMAGYDLSISPIVDISEEGFTVTEDAGDKKTILLVDDDLGIRNVASRALRLAGYEVLEAAGGLGAIHINRTHQGPIHVLVTDIVMKECDGGRVADIVEQSRPETKIILISGQMDTEQQRLGVLTPSRTFLAKPFGGKELVKLVSDVLGGE